MSRNKSPKEIKNKQNIKTGSNRNIAKGMYFGMLIGSAFMSFSMAMGYIAIGMFGLLFGMLFGVAFGATLDKKQKTKQIMIKTVRIMGKNNPYSQMESI